MISRRPFLSLLALPLLPLVKLGKKPEFTPWVSHGVSGESRSWTAEEMERWHRDHQERMFAEIEERFWSGESA